MLPVTCCANLSKSTSVQVVNQFWLQSNLQITGIIYAFLKHIIGQEFWLEDIFVTDFSTYTKSTGIRKKILLQLQKVPVPFEQCPHFALQFPLKLFLRMRIYYSIKFANRDLSTAKSTAKKNKKSKKYIKVAHL